MNIDFEDKGMQRCQAEFNKIKPEESIVMSHFDLAKQTNIKETSAWVKFLKDPRVAQVLEEELQLYKEAQQRKLIQRATLHDRSTGTAQMINALGRTKAEDGKSGQIFIYSYVPPNLKETKSPYLTAETKDIFDKEEPE